MTNSILSFQLSSEFQRRHKNLPKKKKKLSESDVIEVVETVCSSGFEKSVMYIIIYLLLKKSMTVTVSIIVPIVLCDSYGLKAVDGANRVSGPGLESEKSPGMMQGGGRWPLRCV